MSRSTAGNELREALVSVGRQLWESTLIAGTAGNLSARLEPGRILITPTGTHKGRLTPDEIVEMPLDATPEEASLASSEYPFHRESYRASPSVGGVVHTHAPALIAAGIRGFDIAGLLPELRLATSEVVLLPLLTSGSDELGRAVGEAVAGGAGVVLLRQHGAVSVGADVETAANRMELAELAAYAALLSEVGGGAAEMERVRVLARALE